MNPRNRRTFGTGVFVIMALMFYGCTPVETPIPTPSPTPGITLTPFFTSTAVEEVIGTPRPPATPTPPPTPTPTPFMYAIVEGDTLIGVAFRFGITLEQLLAANPGIDPQFLTIGDELIIPLPDSTGETAAMPTPMASVVQSGTTVCYPMEDESLWCFAVFENQGEGAVENVAAQISIYDAQGALLATRTGITPVNLLPDGSAMPVAAWFSGGASAFYQANASLSSAIPVAEEDGRFVSVEAMHETVFHGDAAQVDGMLRGQFREARIAAVAYDAQGYVVGIRVLLLESDPSVATELPFSISVFSLGGDIEQVQVLTEAYP